MGGVVAETVVAIGVCVVAVAGAAGGDWGCGPPEPEWRTARDQERELSSAILQLAAASSLITPNPR